MGAPKQKWTQEEETALKAGIQKYGAGKWSTILKDPDFNVILRSRSNVDLKDKWRNLNCMATGLGSRHRASVANKNSQLTPKQEEDTTICTMEVEKDSIGLDATPNETDQDFSYRKQISRFIAYKNSQLTPKQEEDTTLCTMEVEKDSIVLDATPNETDQDFSSRKQISRIIAYKNSQLTPKQEEDTTTHCTMEVEKDSIVLDATPNGTDQDFSFRKQISRFIAYKNSQLTPKQEEDTTLCTMEVEKDSIVPDATPNETDQDFSSRKQISRIDDVILEAITKLKEPRGSSWHTIIEHIEEHYSAPPDFDRSLAARLKLMTETGQLFKVKHQYMIAPRPTSLTMGKDPQLSFSNGAKNDVEAQSNGFVMLTRAQFDMELEKMKNMTAEEAAAAAAQAVAEAEAAIAAAEAAAMEAEEAEAEAEAARCFADAATLSNKICLLKL